MNMNLKEINDDLQILKQEMEENNRETNFFSSLNSSLDKSITLCEQCKKSISSHNGLCDRCYHEAMEGMEKLTSEHLSECAGCSKCEL